MTNAVLIETPVLTAVLLLFRSVLH